MIRNKSLYRQNNLHTNEVALLSTKISRSGLDWRNQYNKHSKALCIEILQQYEVYRFESKRKLLKQRGSAQFSEARLWAIMAALFKTWQR